MSCDWMKLPDGGVVVLCGGRRNRKKCSVPGCSTPARKQCDALVTRLGKMPRNPQPELFDQPVPTKQGTCDAWICDSHATSIGPDRDLCPPHAARR